MKQRKWGPYVLFVLLSEGVGALSGLLSREGMKRYQLLADKPPLTPPPAAFPIAWSILYLLMGVGAARIWLTSPTQTRTRSLALFFAQLAMNFMWSLLFFNREAYGFSFVWLGVMWALILWMTLSFRELDRRAARLQIPYILWVLFAAYLNGGVWLLNR